MRRKRKAPAKKTKLPKRKTLDQYKKELDTWFSIYIRMRDKGVCFTCDSKQFWKYQQNGHYVSRAVLSLRWDEKNCNCQCVSCNVFRHGNMDEYAVRLVRKYGPKILEKLNKEKHTIVKLTPEWYEKKIAYYKKWVQKNSP